MNLNKADFVECLFENVGFNNRESKEMLEAIFDSTFKWLESGGRGDVVTLPKLVAISKYKSPLGKSWAF